MSPLGDMSARADIFESMTLCYVGGILVRTKAFPSRGRCHEVTDEVRPRRRRGRMRNNKLC